MELKKELEYIIQVYKRFENITALSFDDFIHCYETFFWGIIPLQPFDSKDYRSDLLKIQHSQRLRYIRHYRNINFDIEAFRGHLAFLGHYIQAFISYCKVCCKSMR